MWAPFFDLPLPCEPKQGQPVSSTGPAVSGGPTVSSDASLSLEEGLSRAANPSAAKKTSVLQSVIGKPTDAAAAAAKPDVVKPKPSPATAPAVQHSTDTSRSAKGGVRVGLCADGLDFTELSVSCPSGVPPGRAFANVPIVQDRAYWEIHVVTVDSELSSLLSVGVGAHIPAPDVMQKELGLERSYGIQLGAGGCGGHLRAGDVISVAYDQAVFPVNVCVWRNGKLVSAPLPRGLKGELWAVIFLGGCTVDWAFVEEEWKSAQSCPVGFSSLMRCRGLIGGD